MCILSYRPPCICPVNKEHIINEKRGTISYSTTLYRAREGPIDAQDYASDFDAYRKAVQAAWERCWARAHDLRARAEAGEIEPPPVQLTATEAPQAEQRGAESSGATPSGGGVKQRHVAAQSSGCIGESEAPVVLKPWPSIRPRS